MSRANNAEIESAEVSGPSYNPFFYFEDADKEHAVWFLDVVTFLNELREVRGQKAGGFALYRLGTEEREPTSLDRKSTRLNSSHQIISYAVFCLKKKRRQQADLSN